MHRRPCFLSAKWYLGYAYGHLQWPPEDEEGGGESWAHGNQELSMVLARGKFCKCELCHHQALCWLKELFARVSIAMWRENDTPPRVWEIHRKRREVGWDWLIIIEHLLYGRCWEKCSLPFSFNPHNSVKPALFVLLLLPSYRWGNWGFTKWMLVKGNRARNGRSYKHQTHLWKPPRTLGSEPLPRSQRDGGGIVLSGKKHLCGEGLWAVCCHKNSV